MLTFQLLIIIVLGGLGSTTGALLGTVLVVGSGSGCAPRSAAAVLRSRSRRVPGPANGGLSLLLLIIMLFAREGLLEKEIWQTGRRAAMAENNVICRCRTSPCSSAACGPSTTSASMLTRRRSLALSALTARAKQPCLTSLPPTINPPAAASRASLKGLKPNRVVNAGIARTFQNIRLFNSMTVLENVMVGLDRASRYSLLEAALHIGRYFPAERAAKAMAAIPNIGIAHFAHMQATT